MTSAPQKLSKSPAEIVLTITIVSWNTQGLLRACLASLPNAARSTPVEVHVVDNGSTDGSVEMVEREFPHARVFANTDNVGFARANNQSWREAKGRYWLLLNSDTEVKAGALDELVKFMDARPKAALATARLLNTDGSSQWCAQREPGVGLTLLEALRLHKLMSPARRGLALLGSYWKYDQSIEVGWTWGAALIARREAVEKMGPLSEDFFMYGEDLEWCMRMRRGGWQIWYCREAEVLHHGGQSSEGRWSTQKRAFQISDGVYQAVEIHRGKIYVRALQAAMLFALSLEWISARLRRRVDASPLGMAMKYHWQVLTGSHSPAR